MTLRFAIVLLVLAILAGCGEQNVPSDGPTAARATATPSERRAAGIYRIIGTPLVYIDDIADDTPGLDIVVRFNRRLRHDRIDGEGVGADFRIAGAGGLDAAPETLGASAKHCYAGYIGNDTGVFKNPRIGQRTRLTVEIVGVKRRLRVNTALRDPHESGPQITKLCGSTE